MRETRIVIGGAGLVALGTACKRARRYRGSKMIVLGMKAAVPQRQSSHNSGVLSCGLYSKLGSLEVRMAVERIRQMRTVARDYEIFGEAVVAVKDSEVSRLKGLERWDTGSGIADLRCLEASEVQKWEQHSAGVAALLVPQECIIDFHAVAEELTALLRAGVRAQVNSWKGELPMDFSRNRALGQLHMLNAPAASATAALAIGGYMAERVASQVA